MHVNTTGLKIRKLRELRNYTQEYMAERLKIGQNTYSRYERGEIEPKVSHLRTIAEVLDVPIEEIYSGVWPFVLLQVLVIGLCIVFPALVLWLPETVMAGR